MKNILVILGGGRPNGNTAQLAEAFARGAPGGGPSGGDGLAAENGGARLPGLQCLPPGASPCVQRDGFGELVPKIEAADLLVFASPLYFWTFSAKLKALIERFYCLARPEKDPPRGRYEKYPDKDCALLMTAADDLFWTFQQAASYYKFALVEYIGFHDRGMLLAGGCGDTHGGPRIRETPHLDEAYAFGKTIYPA